MADTYPGTAIRKSLNRSSGAFSGVIPKFRVYNRNRINDKRKNK
jgi:hypothetical protein